MHFILSVVIQSMTESIKLYHNRFHYRFESHRSEETVHNPVVSLLLADKLLRRYGAARSLFLLNIPLDAPMKSCLR